MNRIISACGIMMPTEEQGGCEPENNEKGTISEAQMRNQVAASFKNCQLGRFLKQFSGYR